MTLQLEHGKDYLAYNGEQWEVWKDEDQFTGYRLKDGAGCYFTPDGIFTPLTRDRLVSDDQFNLVCECSKGPPVFREPTASVADLAIAYPVDDRIGFTLTVGGKPQKFEMTREAAAHFAGRIAEALSK